MTLIHNTANEFASLLQLEGLVGDLTDVTVQSVVIVAAVEGKNKVGEPTSKVLTFSSDERRYVQTGLLAEALKGVQNA